MHWKMGSGCEGGQWKGPRALLPAEPIGVSEDPAEISNMEMSVCFLLQTSPYVAGGWVHNFTLGSRWRVVGYFLITQDLCRALS